MKSLNESAAAQGAAAQNCATPSAAASNPSEIDHQWEKVKTNAPPELAMWLKSSKLKRDASGNIEVQVSSRLTRDQLKNQISSLHELLAENGMQDCEVNISVATSVQTSRNEPVAD